MNKIVYTLLQAFLILVIFYSASFCDDFKHIVFFADTAEIADSLINKIILSNRFCMSIPIQAKDGIPDNLQEIVASGKLEVALSLNPEPILPIFAELVNASAYSPKVNPSMLFEKYISNNFASFKKNINNKFGLFLNFAELSNNLFYYFVNLGFSWVNVDNLNENIFGAYKINGITMFSLYKDFPTNQKDVMKWLSAKKGQNIIPVLLTKKHLQNIKFMDYLISVFDNSKYIKPAVPTYISEFCKIPNIEKVQTFQYLQIGSNIKAKLFSAVNLINAYASNANNFNESAYINAQNEFIYLLSYDVLKNYNSSNNFARKFDAAYNNIHRLLGVTIDKQNNFEPVEHSQKSGYVFSGQTQVEPIPNGVFIKNEGLLKNIKILSKNENIEINFIFDSLVWNKISFVDFYIDLNNIQGAGSVSFIPGVSGFFSNNLGWEYALRVYRDRAILYKYSPNGASEVINNIDVKNNIVCISQKYIRGNPSKWGYQAIAVAEKENNKHIVDFLNQSSKSKESIISTNPFEVNMVR
ncbi:MAG: hypothetical protein LBD57_00530 [Endomicrobium sp.]|jgi:hypothetical protein|uniref:hypothetical protein n=1 Tax=Candidatus Endomicrobiellum cubanum TaxID=3242325 RepID=UPI002832ECEE|nr:hypothetical protein [Endomicrobium sp.]